MPSFETADAVSQMIPLVGVLVLNLVWCCLGLVGVGVVFVGAGRAG